MEVLNEYWAEKKVLCPLKCKAEKKRRIRYVFEKYPKSPKKIFRILKTAKQFPPTVVPSYLHL